MARPSWKSIEIAAKNFSDKWKDAKYEKGETHTFYDEFWRVFGEERYKMADYEPYFKAELAERQGIYIDVFWPKVLLVEQKSKGKSLAVAREEADDYFRIIPEEDRPRYILVSDFQTFELYDLRDEWDIHFGLADLHRHVRAFGFIRGEKPRTFEEQDPVSIKASRLMGDWHEKLSASGYKGEDLERLLVRVAFCLFADDTGIFEPPRIFLDLIEQETHSDGSDLGSRLMELFEVLDTPVKDRSELLPEYLDRFAYINGGLFEGQLSRTPSFDAGMREGLLEACRFDWSQVSPAIFGALFQAVINPETRRKDGIHYTSEANILKVIGPLFLDKLRSDLKQIKSRRGSRRTGSLREFREKLGRMRFFDPASGCGNFLVVAYRELRMLEIETLEALHPGQRALALDIGSVVNVDQFYGIEIKKSAVRIAETALWMMDHIMNTAFADHLGKTVTRIPIEASPHIEHGDALELDWATVLPPGECTVVFGNPPYGGSKVQGTQRRAQVKRIAEAAGGKGGTLDYVTPWFVKAGEYLQDNLDVRIGFVATNSITQGEQVDQLWPALFDKHQLEISFAHSTFVWGSEAPKKAQVHVVIIGLGHQSRVATKKKRLFTYRTAKSDHVETATSAISPYLFDAAKMPNPRLTVATAWKPINGMPLLKGGSQPIDGGNYIFKTAEQRTAFLEAEPEAEQFIHPYIGAGEFLYDKKRWILVLDAIKPGHVANMPHVKERMRRVQEHRAKSDRPATRKLHPTKFHVTVIPDRPFLAIPETSSENRDYVPIGWLEPPTIPSNSIRCLFDATYADFALLTSKMHMAWLRHIGGRLKSDFRYSIRIVYNAFPLPPGFHTPKTRAKLEPLAQQVLKARQTEGQNKREPLAYLYDRVGMPERLLKAHRKLDRAVDRLYQPAGFKDDTQRIRYLLELYNQTTQPLG